MSYTRSQLATKDGVFDSEIIPVEVLVRGKPSKLITKDDEVANVNEQMNDITIVE